MLKKRIIVYMAKGIVFWGVCLGLLACGLTVDLWQKSAPVSPKVPTVRPVVVGLPALSDGGKDYGAYLAGSMAQKNQDFDRTVMYFERVLETDPDNQNIKSSLYLLKAIQGQFDGMMPLVREMAAANRPELLAEYVLVAKAVREKDYDTARQLLQKKSHHGLDTVLKPSVLAWVLAGQGKQKEALDALAGLKKEEKMKPFYQYYSGLLHLYFKNEKDADTTFQQTVEHGYPSLTALVFVRDFYERGDRWRTGLPAYDTFQKVITGQDAARDVVEGLKNAPDLTPAVGMAIAFYDISVALSPLKIEETSLLFNEIALYLVPDATIPKIWGAEVLESVNAYQAAARMYDRIQKPSDIILFKKALNLMTQEKYEQALPVLKDIGTRNLGNPLVQRMLGESYRRVKNYPEAVAAYQRAAVPLRRDNRREELGQVLLETGATYHDAGDDINAEKTLLEALKFSPNNALVLNYLGYSWLDQRKNIDEAFEMVKKANELLPDDPHIMDSLALGYYLKDENEKALVLAERSTDLIPYSSIAYGRLGDIYVALGRRREAIYQYKKALALTADMTPELRQDLEQKISIYQ